MSYLKYCDLADLKAFLEIADNSQDALLQSVIDTGTELLDLELGENLGSQTATRYLDGTGTNRIIMERQITAPTVSVNSSGSRVDRTVDRVTGSIIYMNDIVPRGIQNVKVVYTKGLASVPNDLKQFFLMYAKIVYENFNSKTVTNQSGKEIKTKSLESLSITYFGPGELAGSDIGRKNTSFLINYDLILRKYKNFIIRVA